MKQQSKAKSSAADRATNSPKKPAKAELLVGAKSQGRLDSMPRASAILFVIAACIVCLGYTLYTNQTWEDSLITLRQAENLLNGDGLTYNTGSRVHGFTSPINVLVLALCHVL